MAIALQTIAPRKDGCGESKEGLYGSREITAKSEGNTPALQRKGLGLDARDGCGTYRSKCRPA